MTVFARFGRAAAVAAALTAAAALGTGPFRMPVRSTPPAVLLSAPACRNPVAVYHPAVVRTVTARVWTVVGHRTVTTRVTRRVRVPVYGWILGS